jgi:SOS-response transcriptional repressor LexA
MGVDYERLLKAAKELKGWQAAAEISSGLSKGGYEVSAQTLTNWSSRGVSKEGRLNASRIIGCRPLWIETGDGEMVDAPNVNLGLKLYPDRRGYPIISPIQAGHWREIVDSFPRGGADEYIMGSNTYGKHTFALRITGNSMEPEFKEGDIVVIDPDVMPSPGDFVVAKNHEEAATFKKYRPRGIMDGKEVFELIPLNEDYAVMRSDQQPIHIIGTMMEHTRYRR